MDGFLATPRGLRDGGDSDTSGPTSPGSSATTSGRGSPMAGTLHQLAADVARITASMLTRADKADMVSELRAIIREEVAVLRTDLNALEQRVDGLETGRLQADQRQQATDLATTRQGNILLDLRRSGGFPTGGGSPLVYRRGSEPRGTASDG
ncbi:Hypothetical predicted protein [Pelobates cultripes]|uniref:Uncharacterized protein n=1 Tax=Pelobates cultripes TaxID=61616 RepID=A0AAD1VWM8_PELCU|nr:Hypothetical predicted protein [Pelobates cultripes]